MVVNLDRTVLALGTLTADLLLGVLPDAPRRESEVSVDSDAIVVLYTDGLVERRGESLEVGLARLHETLEGLDPTVTDLSELCDTLLARMLPPDPGDDVALVAVKLHRQDRPRPVQAGKNWVPPSVAPDPGDPLSPPVARGSVSRRRRAPLGRTRCAV